MNISYFSQLIRIARRMNKLLLVLTFILFLDSTSAQCPWGYSSLNGETRCENANYCRALGGDTYECLNGRCCRINGLCNSQEIAIDGDCYAMRRLGERCSFSAQCQPMGSSECYNGICRQRTDDNDEVCLNSNNIVEYTNGVMKNCMYSECSYGFGCEYSQILQQYICCGNNLRKQYDSSLGVARMYPRTSKPLLCSSTNNCLFDDTPNCVFSSRYSHYVCCSTFNC
ncbi:unnamed protein product [Auanema sp. JU1783]|nr:unnamed protein product [Auanema sp. JU1783]